MKNKGWGSVSSAQYAIGGEGGLWGRGGEKRVGAALYDVNGEEERQRDRGSGESGALVCVQENVRSECCSVFFRAH